LVLGLVAILEVLHFCKVLLTRIFFLGQLHALQLGVQNVVHLLLFLHRLLDLFLLLQLAQVVFLLRRQVFLLQLLDLRKVVCVLLVLVPHTRPLVIVLVLLVLQLCVPIIHRLPRF